MFLAQCFSVLLIIFIVLAGLYLSHYIATVFLANTGTLRKESITPVYGVDFIENKRQFTPKLASSGNQDKNLWINCPANDLSA